MKIRWFWEIFLKNFLVRIEEGSLLWYYGRKTDYGKTIEIVPAVTNGQSGHHKWELIIR